ncbi:MAG: S8 family serine peptidase, partial [Acidimicrobiales bacterium]
PRVLHPDCSAGDPPVPSDLMCAFADGVDHDANGFVDDIFGWDFFNDDNGVYDELDGDFHGTHVSGTIAAVSGNGIDVVGVSQARIMPLKFIGPRGGTTDGAVKALDYAISNGADLTNNSWAGGGFSQALKDKIEESNTADMLFVAAAANAGANIDSSPSYPSSYDNDNIVSVAATDHNDDLASFSNYGATSVDLGAPGASILSTVPSLAKAILVGPDTGAAVDHRIAYHSFGLEGVVDSAHREDLLTQALGVWMGLEPDAPILLVDDDNGATFETAYQDALSAAGFTDVTTHTVAQSTDSCIDGPSAEDMASYDAVVWSTPAHVRDAPASAQCTLSDTDQTGLETYLDGGGNLALFGVDIGAELTADGTATNAFYRDVLRSDYIADYDFNLELRAVASSPYASLPNPTLMSGTEGAGQTLADAVAPLEGAVVGLRGSPTAWYRGTSMAAPHVAGAAAQVYASYPEATHLQVRDRLMDHGDPTPSLATTTVSGNRLNLAAALDTDGAPVLTQVGATPESFDPTVGEVATLTWTQNEPGHGQIEVIPDGETEPIRTEELAPRAAGTWTWEWDGIGALEVVDQGSYALSVSVADVTGAVSGEEAAVEVGESTPPPPPPSPPPPSSSPPPSGAATDTEESSDTGESSTEPVLSQLASVAAERTGAGTIHRLYVSVFGRVPDAGGLQYWIDAHQAGMPLLHIVRHFAASPEFETMFGLDDDSAFLTALYQHVLGRAPDAGGLAYWLKVLSTGQVSRAHVILLFADSNELINRIEAALP